MHDKSQTERFFDAWLALTRESTPASELLELPALTGSMLPDIPRGAILHIRPGGCRNCRVGDVVIYREEEVKLVAHRLLLRVGWGRGQWLFQKGDNNASGCWIRSREVVGLVTGITLPEGSAARAPRSLASRRKAWRSLVGHVSHQLLAWPRTVYRGIKRIFLGPNHNLDRNA